MKTRRNRAAAITVKRMHTLTGIIAYNLEGAVNRASLSVNVSCASFSILATSSLHVGMSWIRPMTWPAVHTYHTVSISIS